MSKPTDWKAYGNSGSQAPARPRLVRTLLSYIEPKNGLTALDLGCGGGQDTMELLRQGWRVDAVDQNTSVIETVASQRGLESKDLNIIASSFEELKLCECKYDLINGSYSLPFCAPTHFPKFFEQVLAALKPGGVLTCELFGDRDSWAKMTDMKRPMTFLRREVVEGLISSLKILELEENEYEGKTFSGDTKNWHVFQIIAKKI